MRRRWVPLFVASLCLSAALGSQSAWANDGDALVFFAFDENSIPWHHNTRLTLVQAEKHPANPVLRCGPPGAPDYGHAILYGTVLHDSLKFRMWYLGMIQRELESGQAPGWWRPMCYAESDDGIHWNKPELGLVELLGNTKNNVCLIESDPSSLSRVNDFLSVLYEPQDPDPARRYKAAFIAHMPFDEVRGGRSRIGPDESRWASFVCATSADGLTWRVVGDRPMNAGGERFEVTSLYRFGDFYYAGGQLISPWAYQPDGREIGRVMLAYRSADFTHWSQAKAFSFARPGQTLAQPITGQQTHMGAGLWNRGNVLVGLYGMWQDGPRDKPTGAADLWGTHIDLGLILSNDGIHFREPAPDFKVIARGKEGEWDSVALLQGHAFANVGDQTMIWYSQWDTSGEKFETMEIGLATLRQDGFGYLSRHLPEQDAHCITANVPASPLGYRLRVNVEGATAASPLTVELLDKLGQPLPEYSGDNAARITESGVSRDVVWPIDPSRTSPLDEAFAVQLRFPATGDGRLYAVYADSIAAPAQDAEVQIFTTKSGIRFGVWPTVPKHPAPTLFILASTIEGTLGNAYYRQAGNDLASHGYLCVSVDLPCHGQERRSDEPDGLTGWRYRCDHDQNVIEDSNQRLRSVLDQLIETGLTDAQRVAACGTSRGGFAALHFAAADPRVKCVAAFAPVTDLGALTEFRGAEQNPLVRRLALENCAEDLAGRSIWLIIGDRDQRVGTDDAIRFARGVNAASLKNRGDAHVDLHVVPEPKGHTTPADAPAQAATWIAKLLDQNSGPTYNPVP